MFRWPQSHLLFFLGLSMFACRPAKAPVSAPLDKTKVASTAGSQTPASVSERAASFVTKLRPRVLEPQHKPWTLKERMDFHHVPGLAVAIIENGELVMAQGYGVLSAQGGEKVNADTLFSVGSVSKLVTAALVLKLRDEGVLKLDQDIQSYLRSFQLPPHSSNTPITMRMLLSHTAGLNLSGFEDLDPSAPLPTILQSLQGQAPAKHPALARLHPAASRYAYSGGGYLLAQLVLQDLTGQPFATLAQERLLSKLGMTRSSFAQPLPASLVNIAKAHGAKGQPVALPRGYESFPEAAATGLWSSATDMGSLMATLVSQGPAPAVMSARMRRDMLSVVAPGSHALGPRIEREGEVLSFYHAGANQSYKAWVEGIPSSGQGLVVLTNARHGDRLYVEIRNAVADAMGWPINQPVKLSQNPAPAEWVKQFEGQYLLSERSSNPQIEDKPAAPFSVKVTPQGSSLSIGAVQGGPSLRFEQAEPLLFVSPEWVERTGVASIRFHRDAFNHVIGATVRVGNARSYLQRATDAPKKSAP